jgi:hypothetical protein
MQQGVVSMQAADELPQVFCDASQEADTTG